MEITSNTKNININLIVISSIDFNTRSTCRCTSCELDSYHECIVFLEFSVFFFLYLFCLSYFVLHFYNQNEKKK